MLVRAYPRETQEMVFDAHERAFAFFRGACSRGTSGGRAQTVLSHRGTERVATIKLDSRPRLADRSGSQIH
jgi:transposase